ncbi:MAG: hypothetical protein CVU39_01315 [Chloroflexi bacterium HGW-Chloroflexi-10]|nr:MAG: hypothetical protein CVU39_01315 [Chloroflexi bacterium HGW-Chloroflexi-10]
MNPALHPHQLSHPYNPVCRIPAPISSASQFFPNSHFLLQHSSPIRSKTNTCHKPPHLFFPPQAPPPMPVISRKIIRSDWNFSQPNTNERIATHTRKIPDKSCTGEAFAKDLLGSNLHSPANASPLRPPPTDAPGPRSGAQQITP